MSRGSSASIDFAALLGVLYLLAERTERIVAVPRNRLRVRIPRRAKRLSGYLLRPVPYDDRRRQRRAIARISLGAVCPTRLLGRKAACACSLRPARQSGVLGDMRDILKRKEGAAMAMAGDLKQPEGLSGPDDKVSVSWLILQRLDDLKAQIADVRQDLKQFKQSVDSRFDGIERRFEGTEHRFEGMNRRFEGMERRWSWSIGLIAVMALGLLAKLLIPGA
ncbi:MAG: hypothetical protein M0Z53_16555 [Thermaerobacter sp.]|nr:hypothetical protein [Thermaerobacter sp.]